jgi:hypothetical protein
MLRHEGGVSLKERSMVEAIRDQWVIGLAMVVLIGLVIWLWGTRRKR